MIQKGWCGNLLAAGDRCKLFGTCTINTTETLMHYIRPACAILLLTALSLVHASGQTAAQGTATPELTVRGDVPAPATFTAEDLARMPRETVSIPEQNGPKATYEGVPLREILKRAGVPLGKALRGKALASYVLARGHDGYQVVFSVGELDEAFGNESIIVSDKRDGKALAESQGPLRLVCARDQAGARSVRMLETLEVVRLQK